jgi:hypothetical protein
LKSIIVVYTARFFFASIALCVRFKCLIAVLSVGAMYLRLLKMREVIMSEDAANTVFYMSIVGSAIGILFGGLLVFLCFRPYIAFAEWCRGEMEGKSKPSGSAD